MVHALLAVDREAFASISQSPSSLTSKAHSTHDSFATHTFPSPRGSNTSGSMRPTGAIQTTFSASRLSRSVVGSRGNTVLCAIEDRLDVLELAVQIMVPILVEISDSVVNIH